MTHTHDFRWLTNSFSLRSKQKESNTDCRVMYWRTVVHTIYCGTNWIWLGTIHFGSEAQTPTVKQPANRTFIDNYQNYWLLNTTHMNCIGCDKVCWSEYIENGSDRCTRFIQQFAYFRTQIQLFGHTCMTCMIAMPFRHNTIIMHSVMQSIRAHPEVQPVTRVHACRHARLHNAGTRVNRVAPLRSHTQCDTGNWVRTGARARTFASADEDNDGRAKPSLTGGIFLK